MNNDRFKFRVYNTKTKNWVHGPGQEVHLFGENVLLGGFMRGVSLEELNECVVLQYTGLMDNKGVEIYEGDTVSVLDENNVFQVKFGTARRRIGGFDTNTAYYVDINCFYFEQEGFPYFSIAKNHLGRHDLEATAVIGNIFENLELLS